MTETETETFKKVQVLELKIQALKERLSELVTEYEDRDANRRVEITILSNEGDQLRGRVAELESLQKKETTEE